MKVIKINNKDYVLKFTSQAISELNAKGITLVSLSNDMQSMKVSSLYEAFACGLKAMQHDMTLEKAYLVIDEYFENELEMPTITIQSTVGAYGHVSVNKVWHNDTVATHELNLSADYLNRPIENIVATLIHEGCHLYALQNNIKDNEIKIINEIEKN